MRISGAPCENVRYFPALLYAPANLSRSAVDPWPLSASIHTVQDRVSLILHLMMLDSDNYLPSMPPLFKLLTTK